MKKSIFILLPACMFVLSHSMYARQFTEQDHPDSLLDFSKVFASASNITATDYPDADDVLVDDYIYVTYNADGTSITTDDTYFKVLTEKGKRNGKTLTRHFNQTYSSVKYLLIEVIRPDGTRRKIDISRNSSVAVSRGQMSMNIYNPNQKIHTVGIPGLEVEDIVHYVVRHTTLKSRAKNTWSDLQIFEYTSPIKHYVYEVAGPVERPLKSIVLKNPVPGKITSFTKKTGDTVVYRWEVKDMPRMFREPQMPSLHTVIARLLISTASSWEEISRWYYSISKPHLMKTTEEMKQKAEELVREKKTRREKIEAVFYYVSQHIRYMGLTLEKESPGYEPHDVSMTFERKYGVCRDKAALLASMLTLAGIEAYPVLIHAGPKKDKEVPLPYFNHAITAASDGKGGYILMDSTSDTAKELFPSYLSDSSYLVATPEGEPLRVSPIKPASENMVEITTEASLSETSGLEGKTDILFNGVNDSMYRRFFINSNPEKRRRLFERIMQRAAPGAAVRDVTLLPDNLMDMTTPLRARICFSAPDAVSAGDPYSFLTVPFTGTRVGAVNFIIRNTGLAKRKYPFRTGHACGVRETVSVNVGTAVGKTVSLPSVPSITASGIVFERVFSRNKDILKARSEFTLNTIEFSPEEYLVLKNALKDIEYASRKKPIFKTDTNRSAAPLYEGADALILEDSVTFTLKNRREWTERVKHKKKILTHAGTKRYAELKITYNTSWDEFSLIHAAVTHRDGTVRKVKAEEINVMDARWASRAPRYPKSATSVISFPGVSAGSIISYEYEIKKTSRPFFCAVCTLREKEPAVRKTITLIHPESTPCAIENTYGAPRPAVSSGDGKVSRTWSIRDTARVKDEPGQPPLWMLVPSLILSAGDWDSYRQEVHKIFLQKLTANADIRKQVQKLKKVNADNDYRTVKTIRDLVMKSVRTAGPSFTEAPLSVLTPAKTTLAEGYGSRTDIVLTLAALLKAAGYRPEIILATEQVPLPEQHLSRLVSAPNFKLVFTRPLVRIKLDGWIYMGDTGQYAVLGSTRFEGRFALSLEGDMKPFRIRIPEKYSSGTETVYTTALSETGDAEITYTKIYRGVPFGMINMLNRELTPENRRRHFKQILARISQSAQPLTEWTVDTDSYPAVETFKIRMERFAVRDGTRLYCTLPEYISDLYNTSEQDRVYPYSQRKHTSRTVRTEISAPHGWALSMAPGTVRWTQPGFSGTVAAGTQEDGNRITVTQHADLTPYLIRSADYPSLRKIEQILKNPESRTVMFVKD